jgi:hypothetical protein
MYALDLWETIDDEDDCTRALTLESVAADLAPCFTPAIVKWAWTETRRKPTPHGNNQFLVKDIQSDSGRSAACFTVGTLVVGCISSHFGGQGSDQCLNPRRSLTDYRAYDCRGFGASLARNFQRGLVGDFPLTSLTYAS